MDTRNMAAGTPANIYIDTAITQGAISSQLWRNLAQGGEEPTDMIAPIVSLVKELQPQLIRVDHLYDYYEVYKNPNEFDFSKLDGVVKSIIATGAKPLLSISYTPANMAKNNQNAGEPENWDNWYSLVKATSKRYSVDQKINGIYYEVWNEPDLFGSWKYNKSPNYSQLYTQTARAIVDGAPNKNYKVGGPAITGFYPNWIKSLFKTASENNLPLDFISWHKYSKNPDDYQKDVFSLSQILTQYPAYFSIEKLITEVGPDSEPSAWYDNSLSGIHLMSLATRLSGQVHRIFPFEIVDGPTKRSDLSTGWGLITHSSNGSKPKPRYQAIKLLNQLKGQRLSSGGDGTWVTSLSSIENKTIRTLLVNYDPNDTHLETVPITFQNINNGQYQIKTSRYLGSPTSKSITITNNIYSDKFYLEPNSAILIEVIPQ